MPTRRRGRHPRSTARRLAPGPAPRPPHDHRPTPQPVGPHPVQLRCPRHRAPRSRAAGRARRLRKGLPGWMVWPSGVPLGLGAPLCWAHVGPGPCGPGIPSFAGGGDPVSAPGTWPPPLGGTTTHPPPWPPSHRPRSSGARSAALRGPRLQNGSERGPTHHLALHQPGPVLQCHAPNSLSHDCRARPQPSSASFDCSANCSNSRPDSSFTLALPCGEDGRPVSWGGRDAPPLGSGFSPAR